MDYFVYLIRCSDDSLYCGITNDLTRRLSQHNQGIASKYTKRRLPVHLVTVRSNMTRSEALKLERQVKRKPRHLKIRFLNGVQQ